MQCIIAPKTVVRSENEYMNLWLIINTYNIFIELQLNKGHTRWRDSFWALTYNQMPHWTKIGREIHSSLDPANEVYVIHLKRFVYSSYFS
jgi:hypothetical protein